MEYEAFTPRERQLRGWLLILAWSAAGMLALAAWAINTVH